MKKRLLLLIMSLCILMLAGGCNSKKTVDEEGTDTTTEDATDITDTTDPVVPTGTTDPTDTTAVSPTKEEYVVSDYIKLGQYKGVEVTVDPLEVTEEDIDTAINAALVENTTTEEITDRTDVKNGDIVNIDYEGLKDGVAFDGGTATDFDLTIGSGSFIEGFEEQLIGAKVGDKKELNVTFPKEYTQSPDMAGQAVVFKVTVNAIKKEVVPVLNVEFVQANSDYDTIDAYKESIRASLQAQNEKDMASQKTNNVIAAIIENSEISSYPQTLIDYYSTEMKNYYTQYATQFGMDFAAFLTASEVTEEEFSSQMKLYAESMASQELVIKSIITAESIEISDAEYEAGVTKLAAEYEYPSSEEFLKVATEKDIKETLLWQKVIDFVTAQAKEL